MLKKMTVLAMAVGAVAALALPASASANWLHNHNVIQTNQTLQLTGQARFQGALGGVECQITSQVKLLNGETTATAETFKPDTGQVTEKCKGLGGLAFCQIHNLSPQEPNWTAHRTQWQTTQLENTSGGVQHTKTGATDANAIVITTQSITSQTGGAFCPGVQEIHLTGGNVGLLPTGPQSPTTIEGGQLNGILQVHLKTAASQHTEDVEVSGTLQFKNAIEKNTWGFV